MHSCLRSFDFLSENFSTGCLVMQQGACLLTEQHTLYTLYYIECKFTANKHVGMKFQLTTNYILN